MISSGFEQNQTCSERTVKQVAERTLEMYSTAVLEHTLAPPPLPKPEFRAAMQDHLIRFLLHLNLILKELGWVGTHEEALPVIAIYILDS